MSSRNILALVRRTLPGFGGLLAVVMLGLGCSRASPPYLVQLDESRRLVTDLRIQFNKASDASNRAVMADTKALTGLAPPDTPGLATAASALDRFKQRKGPRRGGKVWGLTEHGNSGATE